MELKHVRTEEQTRVIDRSNRTFMELKLLTAFRTIARPYVLIVPLWN